MRALILTFLISLSYGMPVAFAAQNDFDDLLPFDFKGQHELSQKAGISSFPAVAHFYREDDQECLQYIAVSHTPGPIPSDNEPGHPTFQLIQTAFKSYKPDFVVAEGFTSESHYLEHVASICEGEPGESMYTVRLAKIDNIPFVGGEPTDYTLLANIKKEGYTAEDMAALYVTRQLSQLWRNRDPILQNSNDLEAAVQNIIKMYTAHFITNFTYADWQGWIFKHYNRMLSFNELIEGKWTEPRAEGTKLEQLANITSLIRDQEILTKILEAKDKYQRILVVYGGSHYYNQHKVLESYFGMPTYTAPLEDKPWYTDISCVLF